MRARRVAATISFLLALAASVAWMVVPAGTTVSSVASTSGAQRGPVVSHSTLVAMNGWRVAWLLAVPVVIAGLGLLAHRWGAAIPAVVLLWAFVIFTGFSIGLLYLPAAVAMAVAASVTVADVDPA